MKKVLVDEAEHYNMLWDYAHEVRRSNSGSTLYVNSLKKGRTQCRRLPHCAGSGGGY